MKFKTLNVQGFAPALHGMRNPLRSWDKSDSITDEKGLWIGENDLELAQRLVKSGSEHRKFLRMINVWVDIEAPQYFLAELDTYKISTTRNSTSLQHTGAKRDFVLKDFEMDIDLDTPIGFDEVHSDMIIALTTYLEVINRYRKLYNETKDYTYFRILRQMLPMGYKYQITYHCNYETILTAYLQRYNHKLEEWSGKDQWNTDGTPGSFITWVESLPYFKKMCLEPMGL